MLNRLSLTTAMLATMTVPAFAHLDPAEHGSFAAGFSHPFSGLDHVLAMIAVGLWAAQIGGKARLAIPATFVALIALGFVLALAGAPLPVVEPAIVASVVGLGLLVALAVKIPISAAGVIVGIFALFHGHAHGSELGSATAVTFGLGFVAATALLHAVGLGLGQAIAIRHQSIMRALGVATALCGGWLAFG